LWEREGRAILRVPGRMDFTGGEKDIPLVIVDYSHTPDALKKALSALRESFPDKEITLIFGAGGNRDREKRPIMGEIASKLADKVIVTSDNPRFEDPMKIIEDILKGIPPDFPNLMVIPDRKEAIWRGIAEATEDEIILIAGKGHEDYQEIRGKRTHLSDMEEVQKAIEKLSSRREKVG